MKLLRTVIVVFIVLTTGLSNAKGLTNVEIQINTKGLVKNSAEAYRFRKSVENEIIMQSSSEIIGGGTMSDGSRVNILLNVSNMKQFKKTLSRIFNKTPLQGRVKLIVGKNVTIF